MTKKTIQRSKRRTNHRYKNKRKKSKRKKNKRISNKKRYKQKGGMMLPAAASLAAVATGTAVGTAYKYLSSQCSCTNPRHHHEPSKCPSIYDIRNRDWKLSADDDSKRWLCGRCQRTDLSGLGFAKRRLALVKALFLSPDHGVLNDIPLELIEKITEFFPLLSDWRNDIEAEWEEWKENNDPDADDLVVPIKNHKGRNDYLTLYDFEEGNQFRIKLDTDDNPQKTVNDYNWTPEWNTMKEPFLRTGILIIKDITPWRTVRAEYSEVSGGSIFGFDITFNYSDIVWSFQYEQHKGWTYTLSPTRTPKHSPDARQHILPINKLVKI